MALILNIETSGAVCSVCLSENGKILAEINETEPNQHTKLLTVLIEKLFSEAGKNYSQLDAVALSSGPGSYTGLRIGASVAKGLCFALEKPLIAVSTLQGMAWQMTHSVVTELETFFLLPVISARKGAFYCALYNEKIETVQAQSYCADVRSIPFLIDEKNTFSAVFPTEDSMEEIRTFTTVVENISLSARNIAGLSFERYIKNDFENAVLYEPNYITGFGKQK